ncbi:MAG: DUF1549 domain-containing protein, partial [Planctomycetaceae bacterium]|nr:DUF1549 domain-containing protein [Planctomycetaceae bacterium]
MTVSAQDEQLRHFENHIRPVLASKCVKCHGEQKQEGGLRLDTREAVLKGGDSGPSVVPGKPDESLLLSAVRYEGLEMPPSARLSEVTVSQFDLWIRGGAAWPETDAPVREAAVGITEEDRTWWAFQPIGSPAVPRADDDRWSENPIDRFVRQQQQEKGIQPAPQADRVTLIRRLYLDVIGVPPQPEEIDAWLHDESPDAWVTLVDRLLADPRYGEHWARHWLDVVRYCESDGWNQDAYRPHIWRYRDYVVTALNSDKPWPEFVRDQLAGDEIRDDNPEHLAAAGFLRLGIYEYNQRDARGHWNDIMNEMTDTASDAFLGMSFACARCHDHKFDPLQQVDYYRLRAFFEPVIWRD